MKLSIAEIIKKAVEAKVTEEKVKILRENNSVPLRMILRYTYDPEIKFLVPNTIPPWNKNGLVDVHGMLYTEARRLKIFLVGGPYDGKLNKVKMESLFIGLLESIDDKDAEIVANMITKKPIAGLSNKVVTEAFPELYNEKFA